MMCTALRIGARGLRSSCASIARNSFLRRSASCTAVYSRAFSMAIDARLATSRPAPRGASRSCAAARQQHQRAAHTAPGQQRADRGRPCPPSCHSSNCCSRIACASRGAQLWAEGLGVVADAPDGISSRAHAAVAVDQRQHGAVAQHRHGHVQHGGWMVSSMSSERDSCWLASARKSARWMASSAAARAASERASASRSAACCCSCRFIRKSSTNTLTLERSTSGTTGDGM